MRHPTPIYECPQRHYGIDTCAPQRRAIDAGKIKFHAISHGHYPGATFPPATLPGLSTLGFWDAVGEQDWGLDAHRNEGIEIVLVETGHTDFEVDGVRHRLQAGSLTVTRPWELHALGSPRLGPGRLHWAILDVGVRRPNQEWKWPPWVILTPPDLRELTRKLRRSKQSVWRATPETVQAFRSLADCVKSDDVTRRGSRIAAYMNLLLVGLLEAMRTQDTTEDDSLVSIRRTVELFLRDLARNPGTLREPWTLHSMAGQCGMGRTAFVKYCRLLTNTSPLDYLNRCRLDCAASRLTEATQESVTDIAFECGFTSSQYFATQFKKHFGCSPRAFRRR